MSSIFCFHSGLSIILFFTAILTSQLCFSIDKSMHCNTDCCMQSNAAVEGIPHTSIQRNRCNACHSREGACIKAALSACTAAFPDSDRYAGVLQGGGGSSPVEPGSMLWLIQRDFLEGKTVQTMVSEALQPVLNPYNDQDIAQVPTALLYALYWYWLCCY